MSAHEKTVHRTATSDVIEQTRRELPPLPPPPPVTTPDLIAALENETLSRASARTAPWYQSYMRLDKRGRFPAGCTPTRVTEIVSEVASAYFKGDVAKAGSIKVTKLFALRLAIDYDAETAGWRGRVCDLYDRLRAIQDFRREHPLPSRKYEGDALTHWDIDAQKYHNSEAFRDFHRNLKDLRRPIVRSKGWRRFVERCRTFGYDPDDPATIKGLADHALTVAPSNLTWFSLTLEEALDLADALDSAARRPGIARERSEARRVRPADVLEHSADKSEINGKHEQDLSPASTDGHCSPPQTKLTKARVPRAEGILRVRRYLSAHPEESDRTDRRIAEACGIANGSANDYRNLIEAQSNNARSGRPASEIPLTHAMLASKPGNDSSPPDEAAANERLAILETLYIDTMTDKGRGEYWSLEQGERLERIGTYFAEHPDALPEEFRPKS